MAGKTALQETAQALFCALADYIGASKVDMVFNIKTYPIYTAFKDMWDEKYTPTTIKKVYDTRVDAPLVTLKEIEKLMMDDVDWYYSSVQIAKKVIEEVNSIGQKFTRIRAPNWSQLFYSRGDQEVMKNIESLFKIANNTQKELNKLSGAAHHTEFGDVNKWSPADIYFASEVAKSTIKGMLQQNTNKPMTFSTLNCMVSSLIDSGDLLPLSLKKQPREVTIKKVNFDRKKELKDMEHYAFVKHSDWKVYTRSKPQTRDLQIYFDASAPKRHIKIRHDASSAALKIEVMETGKDAREGSIGTPVIFGDLISIADGNSTYAKIFLKSYFDGAEVFEKKARSNEMNQLEKKNRKAFDEQRSIFSATLITNAIFPDLIRWLNKDKERSTRFVRLIFGYATSRSDVSGKFVIAK